MSTMTERMVFLLALIPCLVSVACSWRSDSERKRAEQIWHSAAYRDSTGDVQATHDYLVEATRELSRLSREQKGDLDYDYVLAVLNGRLFLLANELQDTNAANTFYERSISFFAKQEHLTESNLSKEWLRDTMAGWEARIKEVRVIEE